MRQDGGGAILVVRVRSIQRYAELIVDLCEDVVDVDGALDGLRTERVALSDDLARPGPPPLMTSENTPGQ